MVNSLISRAQEGGFTLPTALMIVVVVLLALMAVETVYLLLKYMKVSNKLRENSSDSDMKQRAKVNAVEIGKVHEQGKRQYQQDSFGVSDGALMKSHGLLAVIADGMGGLSNGDKVSAKAVEQILDSFVMTNGKGTSEQALLVLANHALKKVNGFLGEENYRTSGSTLIMGLIKNSTFSFLSIGDSRICLYRDGVLTQLNREHIYKNELALRSVNDELTLQEVYSNKEGSGLTSYLGMGELKHIDFPASPIDIYPGDKIMLMSDGIYNALSSNEISSALKLSPEAAAEALRAAIEAKGFSNQDNYTGIIIECKETSEPEAVKRVSADNVPHTEQPK